MMGKETEELGIRDCPQHEFTGKKTRQVRGDMLNKCLHL